MSAKNKKDELKAVDQSAAEAEAKEREYLENDELVPEIAEDYEDSFSDILNTYDAYAHAANLEEDVIERDNKMLRKAFVFAFKAHRNQKRKNGSLYIIHPLAVAGILADLKVDAKIGRAHV